LIVCFGAAALDRKYHALGELRLGTSNPVRGERSFGGVARNVAENLARLGVDTSLVSIVGDDESGAELVAHLKLSGVNTDRIAVAASWATGEYVAIMDRTNDLTVGASDMTILDSLTIAAVEWIRSTPSPPDWIFADCNLPPDVLAFFIATGAAGGSRLAIDAVSIPKVARLGRDLHGLDLLFINEGEARAYLGREREPQASELACELVRRGAATVVLTLGARGLVVADAADVTSHAAPSIVARDMTGAGDALIAGTLLRLMEGLPPRSAIDTGILLAGLTVESAASVHPDLSPAFLESQRTRLEAAFR